MMKRRQSRIISALAARRLAARDLTTGESWTYAEFDHLASLSAALMQTKGVGVGDRVALSPKTARPWSRCMLSAPASARFLSR